MLLPVAVSAQLLSTSSFKMQHDPFALKSFNTRLTTPLRADLADNQMIMGHYDTDEYAENGLGITGLPGVIPISTILTPDELALFMGGKIVKFRVALSASTPVTRVFVAPVTASGSIGNLTSWTCNVNSIGWNEIELATPFELNFDSSLSLMIGFDYKQTNSNYPISAVEVGDLYPSYIYYQGSWQNVGLDSYGNLGVQCIVEKEDFAEYMIGVSELYTPNFTKLGEDIFYIFASRNMGIANSVPAEACTYDVLIDGEVVATTTNPSELTRTNTDIEGYIPSDGLTPGKHTLTIAINSLFGEPVETSISTSKVFTIYENGFDRQMHLIEEFTSNSCTYCPLGISMLKVLYNMRDDIAMVAIHGNQSSVDPCNTAQCDTLFDYMGAGGWPYAAFDRSTGWEDDVNIVTGIGYYEQYHQQVANALSEFLDQLAEAPSFATININSTIDAETNEATITIDGQVTPDFIEMLGDDAKLSIFLTEDSLIYRQLNMGTWVSRYQHDHVFRTAVGSVFGNDINITGETFKNEYTITLPADWNTDKMEVVAFISRPLANGITGVYTDMYVNQANKRKLGEFDEPETLRGDVNGDGLVGIDDVTMLIDMLLKGESTPSCDVNLDDFVAIDDVTALIDYLLKGEWSD